LTNSLKLKKLLDKYFFVTELDSAYEPNFAKKYFPLQIKQVVNSYITCLFSLQFFIKSSLGTTEHGIPDQKHLERLLSAFVIQYNAWGRPYNTVL